jgi:hypothetical protein
LIIELRQATIKKKKHEKVSYIIINYIIYGS